MTEGLSGVDVLILIAVAGFILWCLVGVLRITDRWFEDDDD